ncbi:hypothetical protein PAMP_014199 [Pampus punctatissimus]
MGQLSKQALSKQTLNKLSKAIGGGESWGRWAVATARLHPIRTGSVEKGCGLEPVTSVHVPSAPTAFCKERQRDGRLGREWIRRAKVPRRPAG